MNYEEIMNQLSQNRKDVGSRIAEIPQMQDRYSPANDPQYNAIQNAQSDKIKQLFDHDSTMATTYMKPQEAAGPHAPNYTPSEDRVVDPMIGLQAANTQIKATANEAVDLGTEKSKRKDVLDSALSKGLSVIQSVIEAKKFEQSSLIEQMNMMLKIKEMEQKNSKESTLNDLFSQIMQVQQAKKKQQTELKAASPASIKSGITNTKGKKALVDIQKEYSRIKKANPGQKIKVDYSQNADGTYEYNYFLDAPQKYLEKDVYEDYKTNPIYGDSEEMMNKLGSAAIASGADSGEVAALLERIGVFGPTNPNEQKGDGEKTIAQQQREEVGFGVDKALNLLENYKDIKFGPGAVVENVKAVANQGHQPTVDLNRTLSEIKASIAKARGGTSFTPNEQKMLDSYTVGPGSSKQEVLTTLRLLKEKIDFLKSNAPASSGGGGVWEEVK